MSETRFRARPSISSAHAPPFRLIVAHFLAGAACAAIGGILLAGGSGDLHVPLHRGTLAVMHLCLAGWLSLTAVGVLLQFLPVTSGVWLLSSRLGWVHFLLHLIGVVGLATAFLTGLSPRLAPLAGAVLWTGLVLAAVNLGTTLLRSRDLTVWRAGVLLALLHLVMTPTVGWILLTFLSEEFVARHHMALLVAHAHLGLVGWLFTLVVAVGGRLLPMFLVAPEPRPWQVGTTLGLIHAGLLALVVAVPLPELAPVGTTLLATAVFWWLGVMAVCFCGRKKRSPDAPMATAWGGLGLLGLVAVAGVTARLRPGFDGWSTYGSLALAAGGLMVNGLLYRIVPFLVRLDRFRRLPGNPAVPGLNHLLDTIPHRTQTAILGAGFLLLIADSIVPDAGLAFAARFAVAAGTAGFACNLSLLVFGPPRWRALFVRESQ